MSVYGGDSWAREAQHRKRRVDELMIEALDSSSFKKLSNGKFTCLVCPHRPLLDSSVMLSMHGKGARHRAALSKFKERELRKHEEINKRKALLDNLSKFKERELRKHEEINKGKALLDNPTTAAGCGGCSQNCKLPSKPLIEQARKAASEILHSANAVKSNICENQSVKSVMGTVHQAVEFHRYEVNIRHTDEAGATTAQQHLDSQERREKELKFTAAGWKRDCHGKWYRDENVEFDSDEEDPNVCLA